MNGPVVSHRKPFKVGNGHETFRPSTDLPNHHRGGFLYHEGFGVEGVALGNTTPRPPVKRTVVVLPSSPMHEDSNDASASYSNIPSHSIYTTTWFVGPS